MHEQLTHAAIAQWAREQAEHARAVAVGRAGFGEFGRRLAVDAARYDRIAAVFSALDVPQETCSTCAAVAGALKAYPDSDLVSLASACRAASERFDALYDAALPAIEQAIANEDGLDGGEGERILRKFGYWPDVPQAQETRS